MEIECSIVVIGRVGGYCLSRIFFTGVGELRVPPHEFPVVELRVKIDFVASIFRDVNSVMHGIGCAGRNEMHEDGRPARPRIAFVDDIAVSIDLL